MTPDYLLVLFLVLCPWDIAVPVRAPESTWDALKQVALDLEVVGSHEHWANDFNSELGYVRRHWEEVRFAPPICCARYLPPSDLAKEKFRLNAEYIDQLNAKILLYPWHEDALNELLDESKRLRTLWDGIVDAANPEISWARRRNAMQRLAELMGPGWLYKNPNLPAVPIWHFRDE